MLYRNLLSNRALAALIVLLFCISAVSCTGEESNHKKTPASNTPAASSSMEKSISNTTAPETSSNGTGSIVTAQTGEIAGKLPEPIPASGNIKIKSEKLNIRMERSTESKSIGELKSGDVLELLAEGKDAEGKTWYMVNADFGVSGWAAAWFCEKTDEKVNRQVKSKPGKLLVDTPNNALFVDLLLEDDFTLDHLLLKYGGAYTISDYYADSLYTYDNGITIEVSGDGKVVWVGVGEVKTYVADIKKRTCDIFSHEGDEILVFYEYKLWYHLLVLDASTKEILGDYDTGYLGLDGFDTGNFFNDGGLGLYLNGNGDGVSKRDLYKVINDDFIKVYDINSFDLYRDGVQASIEGNSLNLAVHIGEYSASDKSVLPDRVFYNTAKTIDKNKLLSIDPEWVVINKDGKWFVRIRYTVNIVMLTYYWGPPEEDMTDNSKMLNDLARVDILVALQEGAPRIESVSHVHKYNTTDFSGIKPILDEEGVLINGPRLGMTMEEGYESLGGDPKKFESTDYIKLDGVSFFEFCGEITDITVETDKYVTTRGLKVGDTIETVEKIYGKPDIGFSGDECVEYKSCYGNEGLKVNYYRGLSVYYKDGKVDKFTLYQIILD